MSRGIFVGLSTIDIIYGVDSFPEHNSKVAARSQDVFVGGPATNAAITFAHLGGNAVLVTAVGRHPISAVIRDELQHFSAQLIDLNPTFEAPPVISSVSVDGEGRRNVVSANDVRLAEGADTKVDARHLEQASVVLVDGHFMASCQAWAAAARARHIPVVFDGGSWKDGTDELLKSIDTAICSADFAPPGCSSEDEIIGYLKDHGVTRVAITRGADPVTFSSGNSSGTIHVPPVEVVDTTGAGDIFHGAFCYFTTAGQGFIEALGESAKVAAESCRYHGTREWTKSALVLN